MQPDATYKYVLSSAFMVEELMRWLVAERHGLHALVETLDFSTLTRVHEQSVTGDGEALLDSHRVGPEDLRRDNAAALLAGLENPLPSTLPELVGALCRRLRAPELRETTSATPADPGHASADVGGFVRPAAMCAFAQNEGVERPALTEHLPRSVLRVLRVLHRELESLGRAFDLVAWNSIGSHGLLPPSSQHLDGRRRREPVVVLCEPGQSRPCFACPSRVRKELPVLLQRRGSLANVRFSCSRSASASSSILMSARDSVRSLTT